MMKPITVTLEDRLSLEPDPEMRWIYDSTDPRYNSDEARYLRDRRDSAIRSAPRWMIELAHWNDLHRKEKLP